MVSGGINPGLFLNGTSSPPGLMVPLSPLNSPSLNPTESEPEKYLAGVFDIQYGFLETNVSSVNVTTGFVFKLERFGSNDTYYIFHVSYSVLTNTWKIVSLTMLYTDHSE